MVYHEIRKLKGKEYNYLIYNAREGKKWRKASKYIGEGILPEATIKKEIEKFKIELKKAKYISKEQVLEIENIRKKFNSYLRKSGKIGIEKFDEWFFTELTYNSNAIEGNILSLRETSMVINENIVPKGVNLRDVYEARNHKNALEFLKYYKGDLNEGLMLKIHSFILKDINDDNAGKYRKVNVYIRGEPDVVFPNSDRTPKLMKDFISFYKKNKNKYHPLELAAISSMKFVSIHPFIDGNGRVSRLIMNLIMKKFKYPEINIYFKDRQNYLRAVKKAHYGDYNLIIDFLIKTMEVNYKFIEK